MPHASSIEEVREAFATHRYVKVEGLLEAGLSKMLYDYVWRRAPEARPARSQGQEGATELPADQLMDYVLAGVQPRIQELCGLELDPTYSFTRIYRRGNRLRRHRDRPSCEVSASVNLGPALDPAWPLWIQGPLGESAVEMAPGDAVLYRGIECDHWREQLEAEHTVQLFLHYVERGGRYAEWKFDKRPALGT